MVAKSGFERLFPTWPSEGPLYALCFKRDTFGLAKHLPLRQQRTQPWRGTGQGYPVMVQPEDQAEIWPSSAHSIGEGSVRSSCQYLGNHILFIKGQSNFFPLSQTMILSCSTPPERRGSMICAADMCSEAKWRLLGAWGAEMKLEWRINLFNLPSMYFFRHIRSSVTGRINGWLKFFIFKLAKAMAGIWLFHSTTYRPLNVQSHPWLRGLCLWFFFRILILGHWNNRRWPSLSANVGVRKIEIPSLLVQNRAISLVAWMICSKYGPSIYCRSSSTCSCNCILSRDRCLILCKMSLALLSPSFWKSIWPKSYISLSFRIW